MFKKMPIRLRLTVMMVILLTICCVGLTLILNFSAGIMATRIDAAVLSPAQVVGEDSNIIDNLQTPSNAMMTTPSEDVQEARTDFQIKSVFYLLLVIVGGGILTYYVSGKVLKPLDTLNSQIKNRTVHNLSETMDIPPTNDEIAELTQSFNEMTDKLNDAFMMQSRFSASAAHELRTPLAVLKAKVDVFKKKHTHSTEEYIALISVFEKQTQRLSELVRSLLDMTNMNVGFENETICLKDVLEDIVSELSHIANEKNVTLYLDCADAVVYGNIDLLYQAFYNLVENGIKYNIDGGKVMIKVKSDKKQIIVDIKDTGIGIPDEEKKNIFEPFYRVDKSRSREMGGSGLGLSIVQSIINKHNGKITVTDNKNGGTWFKIILN
ncbi:HAMP domain-containing histidine kinase [Lysinibacillus agricola]|uniref:histidine kinase n=1 Tax=Lysinibacillus agricola TaxID=2590012 RepID=A0ABX7AKU0_9BACI|nr:MULTISPECIES: HAMP domain-containing sensor histidine kinase [Lysinibacillus]KOS62114.1 histidine kinase [Lysinibacillus sp. FJAT-14222]QQP10315.1 HAMP domain-containing histidine kinase [Lysinibacillus agricola]